MEIVLVDEDGLGAPLRAEVGALLAGILDEGPRYRGGGWRTLRPSFRALALDAGGRPAGQVSAFEVVTEPDVGLYGLGDLAVHPRHRGHGLARRLCAAAVAEARGRGAGVLLAKTQPMRKVLAELGFAAVERFDYYYEEDGACVRHPDWMAAVLRPHPTPVRLAEGDF
jgi:GNAT superfamily N-acetyltransferase